MHHCLQDPHGGVLDSPPIIEEMACDPVLSGCKLIAASANDSLLPRSGDRGFPHYGVLLEWNNRFGLDMMSLLRDNAREYQGGADTSTLPSIRCIPGAVSIGSRHVSGD